MRPDRAIVKKAIVDAGGNLSRAASLLGCTRQSLYTWIYQHGLEREAGIRMDRRAQLDRHDRMDGGVDKNIKSTVYSAAGGRVMLPAVEAAQVAEIPVQATIKVPDSLWQRVKMEALRQRCTVSEYVKRTLEASLPVEEQRRRKDSAK